MSEEKARQAQQNLTFVSMARKLATFQLRSRMAEPS